MSLIKQFRLGFVLIAPLAIVACASISVEKPSSLMFGASEADIARDLEPKCTELNVKQIQTPQIPGVERHTQIDCFGFEYFGSPRLAEFVFAEDRLILTWILVDEADLPGLESAFVDQFGEPSIRHATISGFADSNAAVRKDIPEALYYSDDVAAVVEGRMLDLEQCQTREIQIVELN